ncbi:hypothetical protein EN814_16390 [Mesorhizobium sp. M2D.F.Ca.ET.171.01.1.1]|uniref:hypothetical protein n=1 Tax=unclassified Mesorhizobium TaxID=325217 RepID=UPI001091E73B|nr:MULTISPECIES: hypothetical protein [unclassified Mesorhizobium]TGS95279.1 hypothetical protein EN821_16405 [Mesorhizobium sp. M2D.F.Ca.ET.178.01.1.1]TGT10818.1 hypothetical protein EN814_16390 [Mesorhizobium sp. M2D.F.Ca.ET.171.01.1.1]
MQTTDHETCDGANIERGERFLAEVPRHLRGPSVPALKGLGLTVREATEAIRRHNLSLGRAS